MFNLILCYTISRYSGALAVARPCDALMEWGGALSPFCLKLMAYFNVVLTGALTFCHIFTARLTLQYCISYHSVDARVATYQKCTGFH